MLSCLYFFFFNDTATTEIYTLSLHDALPICRAHHLPCVPARPRGGRRPAQHASTAPMFRSEEHTSELQSHSDLVCRLLLEKKNNKQTIIPRHRLRTRHHSIRLLQLYRHVARL